MKVRRTLVAACLLATACSSGGGSPGTGGTGGSGPGAGGTTGQGGASAGSSGGSATAGAAGTQAGGTGGTSAGLAGTGGSSAAGTTGSAGSSAGAAGTTGQAGTSGSAGTTGSGGRGGTTGAAGTAGNAGRGGTGGSAGSGGGGSGGSSPDGGVANPVTPTQSGTTYRFAWGDVVMEIDAAVGARVSKLSLAGTDLIMTSAMAGKLDAGGLDPTTWGSVFWTSPRSAWPGTMWPPPVNIDNAAYTTSISGTHVVASGPADTTLGVSMAKDYSADAASGWIKIAYTIKATKAQRAAPWEVSRVPRGGIVFFPVPSASSVTKGPLTTATVTNNIVWFDDAPKTANSSTGEKLYADGTTWTAYLLGRNLFLKRFTDTPANMQPTGEGEIDVYPGNGFLEFEVEGPYTQIAANGTLPWSIEWKVVTVPTAISVTAGSTALVDFAKQQVAQ